MSTGALVAINEPSMVESKFCVTLDTAVTRGAHSADEAAEGTAHSRRCCTAKVSAVLHFSKLNKIFFGYFDPGNIFLDNKNK